ncbi:MAG: hypothetical protein VR68_04400 [Peptococcaceae bacterium BRH_c4a]|nr:MAG: hypothetical protein VR68_04400 [Peptococcaceae bacterium BRH_c4a]
MSERNARTSKKTPETVRENNIGSCIKIAALGGICLLLFLAPFFRGLFFAPEQQKALFFAVLVFWLVWIWKWLRRDHSFISHPMDYLMLAFPLIYILAGFNAVNYGLAVDGIVRATLYFIAYWCVAQLARTRKDAEWFLYIIYAGAVGVALAGLMTATELIHIKDGFLGNRLASSLQYANALAGYMVVAFVVGVCLWWKHTGGTKSGKCIPYLFAIGNFLLVAVMIGAKSNGGFAVFALAVLMLAAFLPGWNRLFVLIHIIKVTAPAGAVMFFFIKNAAGKHYGQAWIWILSGVLLIVIFQWLYLKLSSVVSQREGWMWRSVIAGATVFVLLAGIVSYTGADKIALVTGQFKAHSLMQRVYFMEDAVKMIKERPLLGWGGGGWAEAYRSYQSYSYDASEIHSHYVQTGVETGITGVFVLAGIWLTFLLAGRRACRRHEKTEDRAYILFLTVAAVALGVHAAADFDLSLSALSLVLFTLMALIRNMDGETAGQEMPRTGKVRKFIKAVPVAAISSGLIVTVFVAGLLAAAGYAREANAFLAQKNLGEAIASLEKAAAADPFRADYHSALADLRMYAGRKDKAMAEAQAATARSKFHSSRRMQASRLAFQSGNFKEAAEYAGQAISLAPWVIANYEFAGMIYKSAGLAEMKNNRPKDAGEYFLAAVKLPERIKEKKDGLDSEKQKLSSAFRVTAKVALSTGVGQYFQGNLKEAGENFKLASDDNDQNIKGEALVWLGVLSEKRGDPKNAAVYLNKAKEISPQYEKMYEDLIRH